MPCINNFGLYSLGLPRDIFRTILKELGQKLLELNRKMRGREKVRRDRVHVEMQHRLRWLYGDSADIWPDQGKAVDQRNAQPVTHHFKRRRRVTYLAEIAPLKPLLRKHRVDGLPKRRTRCIRNMRHVVQVRHLDLVRQGHLVILGTYTHQTAFAHFAHG